MSKYLLSKFLYTIDRDPARVCAETEPHQPALPRHLYVNEKNDGRTDRSAFPGGT
jgi:hypothetical protein